ncbi:hypothetical protein [Serinicoccus sediminis]|uniref:COG1470 family protein n=1 Tax=Serinicoccus sediminis TaxID=2306021 RepID=UPI00101EF320|nr:hypothetical protein [Serinicoccus sediminis]
MTDGTSRDGGPDRGGSPGRIRIEAEAPTAPLVTGSAQRLTVTVVNDGPEVEQVALDPSGLLARWVVLDPPVLRLWPRQQGQSVLTVHLPAGSEPQAGPSTLVLVGRTGDGQHTVVQVQVEVAVTVQVEVSRPRPHALETPRRAKVDLQITNGSNVPVQVHVKVTDREGRLHQQRPRSPFHLAAGESAGVGVVLAWRKPVWRGRAVPHDYVVTAAVRHNAVAGPATAGQQEPRTVSGVLVQAPLLRTWWLLVWLGLALATWQSSGGWGWILGPLTLAWTIFVLARVTHRLLVVRRGDPRADAARTRLS